MARRLFTIASATSLWLALVLTLPLIGQDQFEWHSISVGPVGILWGNANFIVEYHDARLISVDLPWIVLPMLILPGIWALQTMRRRWRRKKRLAAGLCN
jgi:hypothetical protein